MNWCITPADVSAIKQAIGPTVFVCSALGVLLGFGVILLLDAWAKWRLSKNGD